MKWCISRRSFWNDFTTFHLRLSTFRSSTEIWLTVFKNGRESLWPKINNLAPDSPCYCSQLHSIFSSIFYPLWLYWTPDSLFTRDHSLHTRLKLREDIFTLHPILCTTHSRLPLSLTVILLLSSSSQATSIALRLCHLLRKKCAPSSFQMLLSVL